jgi:uncharacterized membrane protein
MPDNNIDKVFKQKIGEISQIPKNVCWEKESSWQRLKKKRKQKFYIKLYYSTAAIIILGLLLSQLINFQFSNKEVKSIVDNSISEYEKRQKLAEIEERMSGNYYSIKICSVCDDIYYQSVKVDRPVKFLYFDVN